MAGVARFAMTGDKQMLARLERLAGDKGMRKELRKATVEVGETKIPIVQERTPVDKGNLVRSVRLRVMVSPKKEDIRISIVAGGPTAPYAARVHETHKTKSKFIESVILEAVPTAAADIGARIDLRAAAGA